MYKIIPFLWQIIDKDTYVFQTQTSTTVITNNLLTQFLIQLEKEKAIYVDDDYIKFIFGKDATSVISFLEENKLILREKERIFSIRRIIVVSNDELFVDVIKTFFSDLYIIENITEKQLNDFEFQESDLIMAFMCEFSIEKLEELRECSEKNDSYLKIIFPYDSKLYFTNFYKKSWLTPCPLCFFYELESQLRGEGGEYTITFQTLMDFIYSKKADFKYKLIISKIDYLSIVYILSEYLKAMPSERQINEVVEYDLTSGKMNKDVSYHWGYCDCYE